jgi:AcrR family transcriptional regulator
MARTYTLKRRAEQQAETRQRIVEAAVDLHSVGPAFTTISMIAERAGVQRHTVYAHFPDERSLYLACSGLTQGAILRLRPARGGASRIDTSDPGRPF